MNATHANISARELESRHLLQVYGQLPIEPVSARGVLIDCGEQKLIDFYGGHAVAALGYSHPDILDSLRRQAETLWFQSNAVALPVRARAAEKLAGFAPADLDRVFFVNSGGEANENALRIAFRLTGRRKIVAIEHGFHGRTAAAGAVTWGAAGKWYGFPRAPFDVSHIPRDDIAAIGDHVDGDTAAVILELVQGVAGAVDLGTDFVQAVAAACAESGAVLIVDEVQSGIGRCGTPFATDSYGIRPDIITTAKSMAAGFPCGAMICTQDVADAVGPGDLGSTFGGGPLACALVETVIDVIERDGLMQNVLRLHDQLAAACPIGPVTAIQGKGFLIGLRCDRPAVEVRDAMLGLGILVGTSADPDVIRLLPPYVLEAGHVEQLLEALGALGSRTARGGQTKD